MKSRIAATEAGRMSEYITIKTAERVVTGSNWGNADTEPTIVAQCWANVSPLRGEESWRSLRETNISYWNVEVYWYDIANPSVDVTPTMRVHLDSGAVLEIEDIQHLDMQKTRAVMRCKEIK